MNNQRKQIFPNLTTEYINEQYSNDAKMSIAKLARQIGCSYNTVYGFMKKNNLPSKGSSSSGETNNVYV